MKLPPSSVSEWNCDAATPLLKQSAADDEAVLSAPLTAEARPHLQAGAGQVRPTKNLNVIVMTRDK